MNKREELKPFEYMTDALIKRIESNFPKTSNAVYTKEKLNNMRNFNKENRMKKEEFISFCVGYIHDNVIHKNQIGNNSFEHDYKFPKSIFDSVEEFNNVLLKKLYDMFPDANIDIIEREWLNSFDYENKHYKLIIGW